MIFLADAKRKGKQVYLRIADDGETVFVPEDGTGPQRDLIPVHNVRSVDPVARKRLVNLLPFHEKATRLLAEYLAIRVENSGDRNEQAACRGFLRQWHNVQSSGNPMSIGIAVTTGTKHGESTIYFCIHGVGPVAWMPMLNTHTSERLKHIIRETSLDRSQFPADHSPPSQGDDDDSGRKRMIPTKPKTVLIR